MTRVYIREDQVYSKPLEYILKVFSKNKSVQLFFTNDSTQADLIFDHSHSSTQAINTQLYDSVVKKGIFQHEAYFNDVPFIVHSNGKTDWLGTAFYMINSFQEFSDQSNSDFHDVFGRFQYEKSYQYTQMGN